MKYFVADVHLNAKTPETVQLFLGFLSSIQSHSSLYLLGDIFDTWIGDDDATPLANQIRLALKSLSKKNISVYLQVGNRDFLIGEKFETQTGIQLLTETTTIDLNGVPTLLMHGDLLCTDDTGYQKARLFLRSEEFTEEFLSKTFKERQVIAMEYRKRSGEATSLNAADIMDVNQDTLLEYLKKANAEQIIHGHTHRFASHSFTAKKQKYQRHVLGEWHPHSAQIYICDEQGLRPFEIN